MRKPAPTFSLGGDTNCTLGPIMKKLLFGCLLALTGLLARPATGQVVVQPVNVFQNPLMLVENKDVQKDIKLSDEQLKQIAELSRKYAEGVRGLGFQDLEKRKKLNEATQKSLSEVLAPEQAKRLKQIELQQRGANIFLDPLFAKALAITPEQQAVILKQMQGFGPRWIAIIQAAKGNPQEIQKKIAELNRGLVVDIVKDLKKEQQAKWRDLTGEVFAGTLPTMVPVGVLPNPRPQPVLAWIMNDLAAAQAEARK